MDTYTDTIRSLVTAATAVQAAQDASDGARVEALTTGINHTGAATLTADEALTALTAARTAAAADLAALTADEREALIDLGWAVGGAAGRSISKSF